jgi:hypothetical protein
MRFAGRTLAGGVTTALLAAGVAGGQEGTGVTSSYGASAWVAPNDTVSFVLHGVLPAAGGKVAVFVGTTDVTSLFVIRRDTLTFVHRTIALPAGEHELTVYLVDAQREWTVAGRLPLRVRNRIGFEKAEVDPELVVTSQGQVASRPGSASASAREPYQDFAMTAALRTTHVQPIWSFRSQTNLVGASNRENALRFAERPLTAPRVDLADYLAIVDQGTTNASLGHVGFGQHRHLMNGFASRGAMAATRFGRSGTLSLAALNGAPIVGFSDPTGLSRSNHRVVAGTFGLELLPNVPGGLRVEGTVVDGSILPLAGFNRGAITDAETSEGTGVRLLANDPLQRVRFEAGYSRSKSDYLPDTTLSGTAQLAGVTRAARNAWYIDLTADVARTDTMARQVPLNLALTLRAERIDPLYRSVAANVRPDVATEGAGLQGSIGPIAVHATFTRLRDNLGRISSILTSRTDASSYGVGLPLSNVARWLPTVTLALDHTHQFGTGLPPNSGFAPTHVPDQVNAVGTIVMQWTGTRWQAEVHLNTSDQDNRQAGRERADLLNTTNGLTVSLTPWDRFTLSLDAGIDGARNREVDQRTQTRHWSASSRLQPFVPSTLTATYVRTTSDDRPLTSRTSNNDLRVEWQQRLPFARLSARGNASQAFVRYSRQQASSSGAFADPFRQVEWSVSTGLTLPIR